MDAFLRVLRSGQYILGPELENFERVVADRLQVKHALGVSSGTDAILLALMALGIGPGDEVVVPSFTFFATGGCVERLGAIPVFCDVCPGCYNLDAKDLERRITPRTRAVIAVHLFGQAADLDGIRQVLGGRDIRLIEDAAQAIGAAYHDRSVGGQSDFGTFSFFPSKNLGALGDAGLLVTHEDDLADRARLLRVHGARPKYYHHMVGANFRLDALQAALLSVKLPRLSDYEAGRRRNVDCYRERLGALPGVAASEEGRCGCGQAASGRSTPAGGARLILPEAIPGRHHVWNQFTIRVPGSGRRDALRRWLAESGVDSEVYYPVPLHLQPCFARFRGDALPISEALASEVLSLPIFPEMTEGQRERVVDRVETFLRNEI